MVPKQLEEAQDKFISVEEACQLLETSGDEVQQLVRDGKLTAFKIGERYLRFRKDQVSEIKAKWRINRNLFPDASSAQAHVLIAGKPSRLERIRDFFYFNDFYIVSSVIIATLLYLILSSQSS